MLLTTFGTVALLFCSSASQAHVPTFSWAKQGASGNHQAFDVASDRDGNVYVVGSFNFSLSFVGPPSLSVAGSMTGVFFLSKYDSVGNLLWSRQAGESEISLGSRCAVDAQGNVVVTGSFGSPSLSIGGVVLTNSGIINTFLAKFTADGNLIWAQCGGGSDGADEPTGLAVGASGNVYLSGHLGSTTAMFGSHLLSGSQTASNFFSSFLVKYGNDGRVIWAHQNSQSSTAGLGVDSAENLYLMGTFQTAVDFGGGALTNSDTSGTAHTYLAKFDSMGNAVWAHQTASGDVSPLFSVADFGTDLAVDKNGNTYISGGFAGTNASFNGNVLTNRGYFDVFVAKYSNAGVLLWAKAVAGGGNDFGCSISTDAAGNCYLAGFYEFGSLDLSGITLTGPFIDSPYIAKYDANGNVLWARNACTSVDLGWVHPNAITSDALGNLFLAGGFRSDTAIFDGTTLTNNGYFIAKVNEPQLRTISIGNQLRLSWPTNAVGLHLESATSLNLGDWSSSSITNATSIVGDLNTVTVDASTGSRFFRLNGP